MIYLALAIASFGLQNLCCKVYGDKFPKTLFSEAAMTFTSLIVVVALMAAFGGAHPLTGRGYLIALAFGVMFTMTLCTMTLAMNYGHMGVTLLIQNSSLIVPAVYGVCFWGEKLNAFKIIGMICILILLALSAFGDGSAETQTNQSPAEKRRWILFTMLAFIGDCALGILQGVMSRECATTDSVTFTFWTSIFSMGVCLLIFAFCSLTHKTEKLWTDAKGLRGYLGCCLGIGAGTAGGNCFSILALTLLPSVVMFPVRQGALVLVMWLLGILLYKEKVNRRGIIMLIFGMIGIVLCNLG